MGFINLPPSLQVMFTDLDSRLNKVENAQRFTMPNTPPLTTQPTITGLTSGDPTNPRTGDIWLNTTTNTPKYVNSLGAVNNLISAGGGGSPYGPRNLLTSFFYAPIGLVNQGGAMTPTNNVAYATPFYVSATKTATFLAININGLAGTSGGVRVGIYNNSATEDYPNARVVDAGVIPTDTTFGTTGINLASISQSLAPGLYWLVACRQAASGPGIFGYTTTTGACSEVMPTGVLSSSSFGAVAWFQTSVTGALPATWTTTKQLDIQAPAVFIGF
jgi:hypothetical protein